MEYEVAKSELARHSGCSEDFHDDGFLGSLRPYTGLRENNFHCVVEALLSAGVLFSASLHVERKIVDAVFHLTVYARRWGIDDDGMLVRNRLITSEDRCRLRAWVEIIEGIAMNLLEGRSPCKTIHGYCEYVARFGWGENYEFFLPLLSAAIDADQSGDSLEGYCKAIIKLRSKASTVTDSLLRAQHRDWTWYEPHERCSEEMLGIICEALDAISVVRG